MTQKTPQNHANQVTKTFVFTLRNCPGHRPYAHLKSHQHLKEVTFQKRVRHSAVNAAGEVCRAGGPKRVNFFLHVLKKRVAGSKGLDVDSLVTEHIQEKEIRARGRTDPLRAFPATLR